MGSNSILLLIFEDVINMFLVAIHTVIDFFLIIGRLWFNGKVPLLHHYTTALQKDRSYIRMMLQKSPSDYLIFLLVTMRLIAADLALVLNLYIYDIEHYKILGKRKTLPL